MLDNSRDVANETMQHGNVGRQMIEIDLMCACSTARVIRTSHAFESLLCDEFNPLRQDAHALWRSPVDALDQYCELDRRERGRATGLAILGHTKPP